MRHAIRQRRRVAWPAGLDHQNPVRFDPIGKAHDEFCRRLVRPVEVLPDDDQRTILGGAGEEPPHSVEDAGPPELGAEPQDGRVSRIQRQQVAQEGQHGTEILAQPKHGLLDLLDDDGLGVPLIDLEGPAHEVDEGVERHRLTEGDRLALHPRRGVGDVPSELPEQTGLADSRIAHDGDDLPVARLGLAEPRLQQGELGLSADELGGDSALRRQGADQPVRRLAAGGAVRRQLEPARQKGGRGRAHHDGSGLRAVVQERELREEKPLGIGIDGVSCGVVCDRDPCRVDPEDDSRRRRIRVVGSSRHLLDGQGRGRRIAPHILERLEAEDGDQAHGGQRIDVATKALDLPDDHLHGLAVPSRLWLGLAGHESRLEDRQTAWIPAERRAGGVGSGGSSCSRISGAPAGGASTRFLRPRGSGPTDPSPRRSIRYRRVVRGIRSRVAAREMFHLTARSAFNTSFRSASAPASTAARRSSAPLGRGPDRTRGEGSPSVPAVTVLPCRNRSFLPFFFSSFPPSPLPPPPSLALLSPLRLRTLACPPWLRPGVGDPLARGAYATLGHLRPPHRVGGAVVAHLGGWTSREEPRGDAVGTLPRHASPALCRVHADGAGVCGGLGVVGGRGARGPVPGDDARRRDQDRGGVPPSDVRRHVRPVRCRDGARGTPQVQPRAGPAQQGVPVARSGSSWAASR